MIDISYITRIERIFLQDIPALSAPGTPRQAAHSQRLAPLPGQLQQPGDGTLVAS
jgi:hypothetical protein